MKRSKLVVRSEVVRRIERVELERVVGGDSGDVGCPQRALLLLPAPPRHGG